MQRVAALYDIHGNLPALEAVLSEIRQMDVDLLLIGGDVVPGPFPFESLELLASQDLAVQYIFGNGETAVLAETGNTPGVPETTSRLPESVLETIKWSKRQLSMQQLEELATWPLRTRIHVQELGDVLFCHATPRNENDVFTERTAGESLAPLFQDVEAQIVVCGHTHMQFDRTIAGRRVVNAGSVGLPFGETGAFWLLLDTQIQLRCTAYDLSKAAQRIQASDYPQAADFSRDILHPRSKEETLKLFSTVEVT